MILLILVQVRIKLEYTQLYDRQIYIVIRAVCKLYMEYT